MHDVDILCISGEYVCCRETDKVLPTNHCFHENVAQRNGEDSRRQFSHPQ